MADFPFLTLLTAIPALGGLLLTLVPRSDEKVIKGMALTTTLIGFVVSIVMWTRFAPIGAELVFVEDHVWVERLNIHYKLGIDGISLAMILLTTLLSPLAILCSWTAVVKQPKGFFLSLLFLEAGMIGVFSAADLFLFYVYWELMLIPMALLIGIWGGPRRIYAAIKFVLYTMAGSLLMFLAILYCWLHAGTFDVAALQAFLPGNIPFQIQMWLFGAFAISFAIKVPMFPFHTWLPDAHVEAPTAGSVILAGVLLKMGTYGFLRFAIPFFPTAAVACTPIILTLSAIGIVYGSLMSMAQTDMKKLIAYSSVAHLGFVMLGVFSGTVEGAQGGVAQMINHGISTGALFLLVGVIYERTHTRGLADFGGLAKTMPVYATLFMIVTLSSIGLPGLNGFVGEFLVLLGTYQTHPVAAVIGALGVVLGAVYMLTMYRNVFFGPENPRWRDLPETNATELVTLLPLVALCVFIGVMPGPLLRMTEAPVTKIVQSFHAVQVVEVTP
jgi:NADH-quinone oxidoreductase subunit M